MKTNKVYKWELIAWLWFAFFLNQGDRQIYNTVLPLIRDDLALSDIQSGLIATIFTLFYGLLVPFAGYAGDLFQRKWVVFLSLLFFSAGTLLTGFANSFILLVIFRSIATGAGEAFYYPAANTLIADHHQSSRGLAISIHQTANYIGVVASGFLAGYIGDALGWRYAFYTFGGAGILLAAIIAWRITPDKTSSSESSSDIHLLQAFRYCLKKNTVILMGLAFGMMIFSLLGYLTWMPTFFHEQHQLSLSDAGFSSMFYHHLLAFVGVLIGGKLSDKWIEKRRTIRVSFKMLGMLAGAPFILLMVNENSLWLCYLGLAGYGFFRGIYDSNLMASLYEVIEEKYRASATGLMVSFGFVVGSTAPVVLGWLKTNIGLSTAMQSLAFVQLLSALLLFIAYKFTFQREITTDVTQ